MAVLAAQGPAEIESRLQQRLPSAFVPCRPRAIAPCWIRFDLWSLLYCDMASEPTEEAITSFISFTSSTRDQAVSLLKVGGRTQTPCLCPWTSNAEARWSRQTA